MTDTARRRVQLVALRAELRERHARIRAHRAGGVPSDSQDQVTARENDDVIQSLELHIENELRLIAAAMRRIEQGSYGTCVRCARDIEHGRLDVLPYSIHCSHCA